jgi:hypothetical protein
MILNGLRKFSKIKKHSTIYYLTNKNFSLPLSFKTKINTLLKNIHPDILGSNCPNEFRKINERCVQELNSYIECLDKGGAKFENKNLDFYIVTADKTTDDKEKSTFSKLNLTLDEISSKMNQTNRISLQLKYNK